MPVSRMAEIGPDELVRAATILVKTALRVSPGERFVAVGDLESQEILTALETAGREAGAEVAALRIDQLRSYSTNHSGQRPHKVLPDGVRRAMLSAQASAFVASSPHAESSMREQLLHVIGACRVRHAHMPGISPSAFVAGLGVDHAQIGESAKAIERRLEVAREITCESDAGTKLVIHPGGRRWVPRIGKVGPAESVTFPTGSLIVAPESIRGKFVATASLGEFFGAREGLLRSPVVFHIDDGKAVWISAESPALVKDIEAMLGVAPNSDRVGLVVLGINSGVGASTGEVAVDQHRPGIHLVFGDPMAKVTGAGWVARTSFAACQSTCSVYADGELVVYEGVLVES